MLKATSLTNQAVVEIATPEDYDTCYGNDGNFDPPCLRLLDFKVIPQGNDMILSVTCYFRSWDLWAGFPSNLGGLELLKQHVAEEAGLKSGPTYNKNLPCPLFSKEGKLNLIYYPVPSAQVNEIKLLRLKLRLLGRT